MFTGVIVTPVVYSAQTLTGALIGTCFFSLVAGFASGFWFSQRLRGTSYPEPSEQRQQLNRLTESSESPGFNNKSINLVLNVPPKNPNGKNANSSAENKPVQKVKKTYIWYRKRHRAVWGLPQDPTGSGTSSPSSSSDFAESEERNDEDGNNDDEDDDETTPTSLTTGIATDYTNNTQKQDEDYESVINDETCMLKSFGFYDAQQCFLKRSTIPRCIPYQAKQCECIETILTNKSTSELRNHSISSDGSADSFDDLYNGRHPTVDNDLDQCKATNAQDQYMIPTGDPRDLNEKILSLFNPQFLPNFNDMIIYMTAQYDSTCNPPSRSQSVAQCEDDYLLKSYRKRDDTNSICFRHGFTYEARKW